MRTAMILLFLVGCACAKPADKPKPPSPPPPPVVEKVTEVEILRYKAAFFMFKALEAEILEKYKIRVEDGEAFDPDTAEITRVKRAKAPQKEGHR